MTDPTDWPIADVERETGIARATLRIWERRYGFPRPGRDTRGERAYPREQVERLALIQHLLARGHRPGRLVGMTRAQLGALAEDAGRRSTPPRADPAADALLQVLRRHEPPAVLAMLRGALEQAGLEQFVARLLPAFHEAVGCGWGDGSLQVYEEHLYSECVQQVLRTAIASLPARGPDASPRVVLATFPHESHGLGLLMAEALLALEGCAVLSLGVRTPIEQIAAAAEAFRADVVGLSFSAHSQAVHVLRGLEQLRSQMVPGVAVWAGGASPSLRRRRLVGVTAVPDIALVPALVTDWRQRRG